MWTATASYPSSPARRTERSRVPLGPDYTPALNNGPDSFTFTASDGTLSSNTATVSITVGSVDNYILNHTASGALTVSGNGTINVPRGIIVDSSSSTAIVISSNASVTATSIQEVGGFSKSGNAAFHPNPVHINAAIADPFEPAAPAGEPPRLQLVSGSTRPSIQGSTHRSRCRQRC